MNHPLSRWPAIGFGVALLVACSKPDPAPPVANATAPSALASAQGTPAVKQRGKACEMITQDEMSALLGGAVIAKENNRFSGQTHCIYSAASGISPYAELKVEWGDAAAAMAGVGMANKAEPGITNPLEGLGDQAVQIGPALMIRSGADLVTIVLSGVDDTLPKARKIFEMAKAKL